jgi:hypothetical protein
VGRLRRWFAVSAIGAVIWGFIAACSLTTDLSGLRSGEPDAGQTGDALAPSDAVSDGEPDGDGDDNADASVFCRPGFTGATCSTPCPSKTAGTACEFRLILGLDIPQTGGSWKTPADVPYSDNATASAGPFTRVAYRLVLDAEEVWVELDAYTQDPTRLGVPVDWIFDQAVQNVVVHSFSPNQPDILVPTGGNIELWSNCYGEGPGSRFDHDDNIDQARPDCYGSLQLHVSQRPVLSFNHWASGTDAVDVGIGPSPEGGPDWTFAENAKLFQKRRFEVYVR